MKIKMKVETEHDVKKLYVDAGVRYWEDSTVNGMEDMIGDLIPCREGERWKPIIDIETGIIINWEVGKSAEIHYKVCDDGIYTLKDSAEKEITSIDGYVPSTMYPKDNGYGDYIIMNIDTNGKIADWSFNSQDFETED